MKNLKYILKLLWKEDKIILLILLFDIIISAIASFPFIIFPKYIIELIINGDKFEKIVIICLIMILSYSILTMFSSLLNNLELKHNKRIEFKLHQNITEKTAELNYESLLDSTVYDKMFLASDIANGNNFMNMMNNMKSCITNTLVLIGTIYLIIHVNVIILVFSILSVLVNTIISSKLSKKRLITRKETTNSIRVLEYIGRIAWHLDYSKDLRIFDFKDYILKKHNDENNKVLNRIYKDYDNDTKASLINLLFSIFQNIVMYLILAMQALKKIITIGDFTMYMGATNTFKSSLSSVLKGIINLQSTAKYFENYNEFMSLPSENSIEDLNISDNNFKIEFKNVSYKYPNADKYSLKNVNLTINKGQHISIVGKNGAGKTTFIKLLLRLCKPTEGEILLNGENIEKFSLKSYFKFFSCVFQDYKLLSFKLYENLTFKEEINDSEHNRVKECLLKCGLNDFINKLPSGIDSIIGQEFNKDGKGFSGGEGQKIAIARALYKDSPLIILDEPTAALDAKSEHEIFEKFNLLSKDKTALYITHRLYSTKFCDHIILFENSEIKESGTHQDLMKLKGKYYEMFNLQRNYYI